MRMSEQGMALLKRLEGCRLTAYRCSAGVWTIGYGHTAEVTPGMSISPSEADILLLSDVMDYERCVNTHVKVPLRQCQFDALVCFAFNVGARAFAQSTLCKKINAGQDPVPEFKKWIYAGNQVNEGLVNRRGAEISWYLQK